MVKPPKVMGLTLCHRFELDPTRLGVASLVGIFQALRFATFPSPIQKFVVYAGLYDGLGEGTMELVLTALPSERDLFISQRWASFAERNLVINLIIPVACVFPTPGKYSLSLRFDQELVSERTLRVYAE
jgi:hypothetical protein